MNRFDIALGKTPPPEQFPEKIISSKGSKKNVDATYDRVREEILANLMNTAEGRDRLMASMVEPLQLRLHESLARHILAVDNLPDRALATYDKNPSVPVYAIDMERNIIRIQTGSRYYAPIFQVPYTHDVPLRTVRESRYGVVQQAQDMAVQTFRTIEENLLFEILSFIAENHPERNTNSVVDLDLDVFRRAFESIGYVDGDSQANFSETSIIMNTITFGRVREVGLLGAPRNDYNAVSTILGAPVHVTRRVADQQIYLTGRPDRVGHFSISQHVSITAADDPRNFQIGYFFSEGIGISVHGLNSIARITLS